jgi:hypothetical protein
MFVSCKVFVLSGRGLCDQPIPRPEESYRLWRVSECDQVKINNFDTCCEQVEEGRTAKRNDFRDRFTVFVSKRIEKNQNIPRGIQRLFSGSNKLRITNTFIR